MSNKTSTETEPNEMGSDSTPHVEVLDEVAVGKGVLGDVPRPGKDGETNDEGSDDSFQGDAVVKSNVGRRKRGRPSEKDKEGLSVSKKAKNSPPKRKTLKIKTYRNNNGKPNGFSELYVKSVTEKCIFCHDEHLRETFWEGTGENGPESIKIPICKSCHARLRDENVINEMREAIERGSPKINGGSGKVVYPCGICQSNVKKSHGSVICTKCSMWIHLDCTEFTSHEEAKKHKDVFKCRNCEDKDETPKAAEKRKTLEVKNVEHLMNEVLLLGTGTHDFYRNISNTDIESLDDGKWVNDNIISHF